MLVTRERVERQTAFTFRARRTDARIQAKVSLAMAEIAGEAGARGKSATRDDGPVAAALLYAAVATPL